MAAAAVTMMTTATRMTLKVLVMIRTPSYCCDINSAESHPFRLYHYLSESFSRFSRANSSCPEWNMLPNSIVKASTAIHDFSRIFSI